MKNQYIFVTILFILIFPLENLKAFQCANENNVAVFVDRPDGPFCDREVITVSVMGAWIGGGIASEVEEDFSYFGDVDIISESDDNYPWVTLKIRLDENRTNKLKVRYSIEIEESDYEAYQFCSISETIEFEVIPSVDKFRVSLTWRQGDTLNVFSHQDNVCFQWGEVVDNVEIDIPGETSNLLAPNPSQESYFVSSIDCTTPIPKDEFDRTFYVRAMICDNLTSYCNHTIYFTPENFKFVPLENDIDDIEVSIQWQQGDILSVTTDLDNACYQWGELIDYKEVDIINETANMFAPNDTDESLFVSAINNKIPIPKDKFEQIYYVRLFDCDASASQCSKTVFFIPENFEYIPFHNEPGLTEIAYTIFPNPGDGKINISSSGSLQNSTPFPTKVTDVYGNPLPTSDLIHTWNSTYIDISTAVSGFYFIYFKTGDDTFEKFTYYKL